MRRFLLILVIISISQLGCESSLNSDNTNADEPTNASEVGDDTLTYSKVADLLMVLSFIMAITLSRLKMIALVKLSVPIYALIQNYPLTKKELRIFTLMSRTVLEHCISIMLKMIVKIF